MEKKFKLAETTPYGIGYVNALDVSDDNSGTRKVCIVDSGYDIAHPDLPSDPTLISGESFVPDYEWNTDEASHGTHVAGIIMAIEGNGFGVKGVIRNGLTKVHISKVFDASGSAYTSTIIQGFQSCVEAESNVINMSLGGPVPHEVFAEAIADAYELGILTFAAAGNSYDSTLSYPASHPFVTSVASINGSYNRSPFSTYNDAVDLCAPGSSVLSTVPGMQYNFLSGTSMACPHVAGVAALVWSHYPQLNHDKLRTILEESATDLPHEQNDGYDTEFGHGLVNALAAYEAVLLASTTPNLSPAPSSTPTVSSPSTTFCSDGIEVKVGILTDDYPQETSWDIKDAEGSVIESRNYVQLKERTLYEDKVCLVQTETCEGIDYTFTIYDTYGDGTCCLYGEGQYDVTILGELVASGGSFGFDETTSLCRQSNHPSSTPSEFFRCPDGVEVTVKVFTDDFPSETSWEIKRDDGSLVESKSNFSSDFSLHETKVCLDTCEGNDYEFTIKDSYGDGLCCQYGNGYYDVHVEKDKVISGASFGESETTSLCQRRTSSSKEPVFKPRLSSSASLIKYPIAIMLIGSSLLL